MHYQPISGSEAGLSLSQRLAVTATAPIGGSTLFFPGALARGVERCLAGGGPTIASSHARWFFGSRLIVWTNPRRLTMRLHDGVSDGTNDLRLGAWFLDGADWSDVVTPVRRLAEHRETLDLIRFGSRYPEMPVFGRMLRRAQAGRPVLRYGSRLDSEERIHGYFRYFLQLIENIRRDGFREQKEIARSGLPAGLAVRGRHAFHQREIGAALDATGRLLRFVGGRHRTAIAQALGIPAVPVEIRLVHASWLADECARTGLPPAEALEAWVKRASLASPGPPSRQQENTGRNAG